MNLEKINIPTAALTLVCVIAGVTLIVLKHEAWGGTLLSFALGGAAIKPIVRGEP